MTTADIRWNAIRIDFRKLLPEFIMNDILDTKSHDIYITMVLRQPIEALGICYTKYLSEADNNFVRKSGDTYRISEPKFFMREIIMESNLVAESALARSHSRVDTFLRMMDSPKEENITSLTKGTISNVVIPPRTEMMCLYFENIADPEVDPLARDIGVRTKHFVNHNPLINVVNQPWYEPKCDFPKLNVVKVSVKIPGQDDMTYTYNNDSFSMSDRLKTFEFLFGRKLCIPESEYRQNRYFLPFYQPVIAQNRGQEMKNVRIQIEMKG